MRSTQLGCRSAIGLRSGRRRQASCVTRARCGARSSHRCCLFPANKGMGFARPMLCATVGSLIVYVIAVHLGRETMKFSVRKNIRNVPRRRDDSGRGMGTGGVPVLGSGPANRICGMVEDKGHTNPPGRIFSLVKSELYSTAQIFDRKPVSAGRWIRRWAFCPGWSLTEGWYAATSCPSVSPTSFAFSMASPMAPVNSDATAEASVPAKRT